MALTFRTDPGPCPICGAGHTACTTGSGPVIEVQQLPARDALAAAEAPEVSTSEQTPDPSSEFTTATYRGNPKKRRLT